MLLFLLLSMTCLCCLARYFDQPLEEKLKLPQVDWGARKLLGYEIMRLPGGVAGMLHG